jgi:hypothetical protein
MAVGGGGYVPRSWLRAAAWAAAALVVLALALAVAVRARALPGWPAQARPAHGAVVLLRGTPYYWVADEAGVLHWASDTRALVGRYVKWGHPREVTAEELERLPRGDPWLASPIAFVRAGDRLYLVKWESGLKWPALLRVPSAEALRIFGITGRTIEQRVTDQQTWERLVGLPIDALEAELTPVGGGLPSTWPDGTWSGVGTQVNPSMTYPVSITLAKPTLDPNLGVVVGTAAYTSFPCSGQLGLISASAEAVGLAERLTAGLENCSDQGRVTLSRRAEWRFFYVWNLPDDPIMVTGLLLRTAGGG